MHMDSGGTPSPLVELVRKHSSTSVKNDTPPVRVELHRQYPAGMDLNFIICYITAIYFNIIIYWSIYRLRYGGYSPTIRLYFSAISPE